MGVAKSITSHTFSNTSQTNCGTVGWRAPEVLFSISQKEREERERREKRDGEGEREEGEEKKRGHLDCKSDMWSVGCIAHYVLTGGYHPFGGKGKGEENRGEKRKEREKEGRKREERGKKEGRKKKKEEERRRKKRKVSLFF